MPTTARIAKNEAEYLQLPEIKKLGLSQPEQSQVAIFSRTIVKISLKAANIALISRHHREVCTPSVKFYQ